MLAAQLSLKKIVEEFVVITSKQLLALKLIENFVDSLKTPILENGVNDCASAKNDKAH